VLLKQAELTKKEVSKMKTRKPRRLGRTRRVSLRQIFTFCASSFHSRWMAMPGNSCDISFVWWYFVNSYEYLGCNFTVIPELLWAILGLDVEFLLVGDIYMAYMFLFLVLFFYVLSM
jgi:hypothetical protein